MKPSAARVLEVLREHPAGITQMDALLVHGCGDSLAQRVHELRREGHTIADSWETTANGARIKRYRLVVPVIAPPTTGVQIDLFGDALVGARAAATPQPPGSRVRQVAAPSTAGATG